MLKVKPVNKEQVIYFLLSNISLGTYDKRFLSNLESNNLNNRKPLTTNQVSLLDKIIDRYKRQIEKLEISSHELLNLPWITTPIESSPQFTEAHLLLVEDTLVLRSPYKKDFVTEFRKLDINPLWHATDKFWTITASTHNLKAVRDSLEKHYKKVNYCDTINRMIDSVKEYENYKYWDPTLVYRNGNYYIYGINDSLNEATKHIDINTMDLRSLSFLKDYGISVDDSVIEQFQKLHEKDSIEFSINDTVSIEYTDSRLIKNILKLGVDYVQLLERQSTSHYFENIKKLLLDNNIKTDSYNFLLGVDFLKKYSFPIVIMYGSNIGSDAWFTKLFKKVVYLKNSEPINLK